MQRDESSYPADWLLIADKDLGRAKMLIAEKDPELAGFCLQQSIEKFLKAFLLSHRWQLRRIHNLDALLDDAIAYDASLENFRSVCQKITAFYLVERYPFVVESGITGEDVRACLEEVDGLIEKLRVEVENK